MDKREAEMIPIVDRLMSIPQLRDEYAHDSYEVGEYQEALEVFLMEAERKNIIIPTDLVDDICAISDELLPRTLRVQVRERELLYA